MNRKKLHPLVFDGNVDTCGRIELGATGSYMTFNPRWEKELAKALCDDCRPPARRTSSTQKPPVYDSKGNVWKRGSGSKWMIVAIAGATSGQPHPLLKYRCLVDSFFAHQLDRPDVLCLPCAKRSANVNSFSELLNVREMARQASGYIKKHPDDALFDECDDTPRYR